MNEAFALLLAPLRGRLTAARVEPWLRSMPAVAWMSTIWFLSSFEGGDLPPVMPDYVAHWGAWGLLGGLLFIAWVGWTDRKASNADGALIIVAATAWGVIDEFHQSFVPGRDSSLRDVIADAAGAATAVAILLVLSRRVR